MIIYNPNVKVIRYIRTGKDNVYFNQQAIRTSHIRRLMTQRPIEESQKRNNVKGIVLFSMSLTRCGVENQNTVDWLKTMHGQFVGVNG